MLHAGCAADRVCDFSFQKMSGTGAGRNDQARSGQPAAPHLALRLPRSKKVLHLTLPSKADTDRITQLSEGIDGSAVHDAAAEALYMDKLTEAAAIMLSSNAEGKRIGRSWLARHCTNDDIALLVGQYMAWLVDILQEKN